MLGYRIRKTTICFVEAGKPCQADVLQSRVQDPDGILTMPEKGKLLSIIKENEQAFDNFRIAESHTVSPEEWQRNAKAYLHEINVLKDQELTLRNKWTWDDWSCVSGNCTAGGICKDGENLILQSLSFKINTNYRSTPSPKNSEPKLLFGFQSCTFSFVMLIGMCMAAFVNQFC